MENEKSAIFHKRTTREVLKQNTVPGCEVRLAQFLLASEAIEVWCVVSDSLFPPTRKKSQGNDLRFNGYKRRSQDLRSHFIIDLLYEH